MTDSQTGRPSHCDGRPLACLGLVIALWSSAALGQFPGGDIPPPAATQPASAPAGAKAFQPGVWIDWKTRSAIVAGRVVLNEGPIEFLACFPGKEHESVIRLEARATHVYMALGLIGLTPGRPPAWDAQTGRFDPAQGDLVDVRVEWEQGGAARGVDAFELVREMEYARTPIPRPFVFAGSHRQKDGTVLAERSGAGVALVDMPDALLAMAGHHSDRSADLWAEANTAAIPPAGTPLRLIFRAAAPRQFEMSIDFRGDVYVDGRYTKAGEAAELVALARRLTPGYEQEIAVRGALRSDVKRIEQQFKTAGATGLRFVQTP